MGDLLLSAEQAILLLGNLPLECDFIPGAVLFSRLCICVGKSHLHLAMESLSITELVLVEHRQEVISGTFVSPDSKTQLKMLVLPSLCSFWMGSSGLAWGSPSRELLDSSALSSQSLWKHQPRVWTLWLDLLTKRSWF